MKSLTKTQIKRKLIRLQLLFFILPALPLTSFSQSSKPDFARDNLNAVLWQQYSGEFRALSFQAYSLAVIRLDEALKNRTSAKPPCVIVDIDETVLDNSAFEGYEVIKGVSYDPNDWNTWTAKGSADTIPGALNFLKYAASKNVETFYVTNRDATAYQTTLTNLQKFNFPFADDKHLLVKDETSDKEPRRKKIRETHDVLLLCGDNLSDFSELFYQKGQEERAKAVEDAKNLFGKYFIVLPNPTYGDWDPAIYNHKKGLSEQEKADMRLKAVKSF